MKRIFTFIITFALIFTLTACGKANIQQNWQEQFDLGVRFLNEENYEEAIIAFEAAIKIDPKLPEAYIGLADVYIEKGDMDKAREILEKGLENNPDNEDIRSRVEELEPEVTTTAAAATVSSAETEITTTEQTTVTTQRASEPVVTVASSMAEAEITTASITEPPIEDPTLSELKRMENLLRTGMTSNMLRYEEILPFGRTVDSLRSSSIDSIKNLVEQNGYRYDYEVHQHNTDWSTIKVYLGDYSYNSKAQLDFCRGTIRFIYLNEDDTGIRNIAIGDTSEDVLRKLGFSNGAEITECINKLAEPEFDTEEEVRAYADILSDWRNFQIVTGTRNINLRCGYIINPKDGEKFRITNIDIQISDWNDRSGNYNNVEFEFDTDKNDARNFNRLDGCILDIQ